MGKRENSLSNKYFVLLIFAIIAFLVYSTSVNSSFHFDDYSNFAKNPDTMINDLSFGSLNKAAFTKAVAGGFRPIAYLSFALNYYISGVDTTSYHVVNIILHALSAFMIYLIILTLFDYKNADDENKEKLVLSAFFTALFWLVAPFNSQPVIYIVQRMTLMMTLFFLLSFLYYVKGRKQKKAKYFVLSGIFLLLSFLSKQNALIFPLVIVLYELIFERRGDLKNFSKNEKTILAMLVIIMLLPLVFFWDQISDMFKISYRIWGFTYFERELTQFRVLVFYLSLMVLPIPSRLSITHDILKSTSLFNPVTTFLSIIFILGLFIFSILRIKKSPYLSFALLWFFITMSVEAIVPVELMYEHRIYLPGIFLIGAAVDYVTERFYGKNKRVVIALFCAITIIYGAMTGIRGEVWRSELTLWSDVINKYPNDPRAYHQLSHAYFMRGEYDKALEKCNVGLKIDPKHPNLLLAAGNIYDVFGLLKEAASHYKRALENDIPGKEETHLKALINLAAVYMDLQKYSESEKLLKKYEKYYSNNSIFLFNQGKAFQMQNNYSDAVKKYSLAIEKGLNSDEIFANTVKSYISMDDIKSAEHFYRRYEAALSSRCTKYLVLGLIAEGKKDLNEARKRFKQYKACSK